MSTQDTIRDLCPPVLWRGIRRIGQRLPNSRSMFSGRYATWADAERAAGSSWDDKTILRNVRAAIAEARRSNNYERDGRQTRELQWAVIAILNHVAATQSELRVIDFGGSLGSLYRQCQALVPTVKIQWRVVERPQLAQVGREEFQNDSLSFYDSIEEAARGFLPNIIVVSSSVQYITEPYKLLDTLLGFGGYFILDRTPMISENEFITVQAIPPNNFGDYIRVAQWLLKRDRLTKFIARTHTIVSEFASIDGSVHMPDYTVQYRGLVAHRDKPTNQGRSAGHLAHALTPRVA